MKASELIKKLQEMVAIAGDLPVCDVEENLAYFISHTHAKESSIKEHYGWHYQILFKHPGDLE